MRYMYPAIFTENELDGYSVQFVDFENGYTCGDDMEDAVAMAAEVLWLLIDDYLQLDKPLPKPTYPIEHLQRQSVMPLRKLVRSWVLPVTSWIIR